MGETSKVTLDLFWKLSEDRKETERQKAAFQLCQNISDDNKEYVLNRLVRGLGSSAARPGYFTALVEILKEPQNSADSDSLLAIADKAFKSHGATKSEEGEFACGRMLFYGALLRSGVLTPSRASAIIANIAENASKRSYLVAASFVFITDYLSKADEKRFKKRFWPVLEKTARSSDTFEGAWLLLFVAETFPGVVDAKEALDEDFLARIARAFSTCTLPLSVVKKHPAVIKITESLCKHGLVSAFWKKYLDPYVAKEQTYKSSLAFVLLSLILPNLNSESEIPKFLTPNLVGVGLKRLSKKKEKRTNENEDDIAIRVFNHIVKAAEKTESLRIPILEAFLKASIVFDKIAGANIVHRLSAVCSAKEVKKLASIYTGVIAEEDRAAQERVYAGQQLAKLVGHASVSGDVEWKVETIDFLAAASLFNVNKPVGPLTKLPASQMRRDAREDLKQAFFKALDVKEKNLLNVCKILESVADFVDGLLKGSDNVASPCVPFEATEAWNSAMKAVKSCDFGMKGSVFRLLFIHMAFQLFSQASMAEDVLKELHLCYEKSKEDSKKKSKKRKREEDEEGEEPEWVDVVVDLLLSLLSQNKSVIRQVCNSVFTLLCPHMTLNGLQAILDVINPKTKDDEEDEEMEDDETPEDANEEEESEDDSDDDDNVEEEEEEEEEEGKDDIDDEFRARVRNALGDAGDDEEDTVSESGSMDMDDLDEESMKKMDEALSAVFKTLCKKKSSAQKKKEQMDALALIHFRIRVLDLVDIYLTHQPDITHVLIVLPTLLEALDGAIKAKGADHQPFETRLKGSLKKLANIKKQDIESDDELRDSLTSGLRYLVETADSSSLLVQQLTQPIPVFAQICNWILKFVQKIDDENLSRETFEIYRKALERFFGQNNCLLPVTFFLLPIQGNWKGVWDLADDLISKSFDPKTRQFRKVQALTLLSALFHNSAQIEIAPKDKLNSISRSLSESLQKELTTNFSSEIKYRHLIRIFEVLSGMYGKEAVRNSVRWDGIKEALENVRDKIPANSHFQDVKKAYNKIAVPLKIPVIVASKKKRAQKENAVDNDVPMPNSEAPETKKKKKKKKGVGSDAAKKRKEKKAFELEGQFEGLEIPSFAGITLTQNLNFEKKEGDEEVKSPSAKKAKKRKRSLSGQKTNESNLIAQL